MSDKRRRFGTDQKATMLKRCLVDKVPISDLCNEYGIQPNQIYAWQKILFENAEDAFERSGKRGGQSSEQDERITRLRMRAGGSDTIRLLPSHLQHQCDKSNRYHHNSYH